MGTVSWQIEYDDGKDYDHVFMSPFPTTLETTSQGKLSY